MPGCARRCSIGSPIRPTLSKQARSRTVFAGPCGRNAKSDPWRPLFHSASASPYGLRSSRTELYPLNLQRPKVGQIKPPKWAKPTCQKQQVFHRYFTDFKLPIAGDLQCLNVCPAFVLVDVEER